MNNYLAITFFWFFSLSALAEGNLVVNVDATKPQFTVSLKSNPTTGYQWSVMAFDKSLFTLTNSSYQAPSSKLMGAGGTMNFNFKLNPGKNYPANSLITFKSSRPWEHNAGSLQQVSINFK